MGKILCATRGGEASIRTQQAAIQLAKETGDALIFFIVYDMEFMQDADFALRAEIVDEEVHHMCDFLMLMAVERAAQQGIEASYIVYEGDFHEALVEIVREKQITTVILGRPGDDASRFALTQLQEMCKQLEAEIGVDFRILPALEPEKAN